MNATQLAILPCPTKTSRQAVTRSLSASGVKEFAEICDLVIVAGDIAVEKIASGLPPRKSPAQSSGMYRHSRRRFRIQKHENTMKTGIRTTRTIVILPRRRHCLPCPPPACPSALHHRRPRRRRSTNSPVFTWFLQLVNQMLPVNVGRIGIGSAVIAVLVRVIAHRTGPA